MFVALKGTMKMIHLPLFRLPKRSHRHYFRFADKVTKVESSWFPVTGGLTHFDPSGPLTPVVSYPRWLRCSLLSVSGGGWVKEMGWVSISNAKLEVWNRRRRDERGAGANPSCRVI